MNDFKNKLKRQQIALIAGLFIAIGAFVVSHYFVSATLFPENLQDFILGFQTGVFMTLVFMMVFFGVRNGIAISNPERLKKLYISETDERTLFIRQKSGSTGMNVIIYGLIVGAIVTGCINYTVFLTLLGACLFVVTVRVFLKIYYRNKF